MSHNEPWWLFLVPFVGLVMIPLTGNTRELPRDQAVSTAPTEVSAEQVVAPEPYWAGVVHAELGNTEYAHRMVAAIQAATESTSVDPLLIWAVCYTESHGYHTRESGQVKVGSHGELGAMQVKPFWARAFKRINGIELDLRDLEDNVLAGAMILKRGGQEVETMLTYYNTGKANRYCKYQAKVMRYLRTVKQS